MPDLFETRRITRASRFVLGIMTACVLTSCGTYSEVIERRPAYIPRVGCTQGEASPKTGIVAAMNCPRHQPLVALGGFLSAAKIASEQLAVSPGDESALGDYNFAVSRILETLRAAKLEPWAAPVVVPSPDGSFTLTHKPDPRPAWNPALYDFIPADEFDIQGSYVTRRTTRTGVGAPTVAIGREANQKAREAFAMSRVYYGVTTLVQFEGRRCVISFHDPLNEETARLGRKVHPLAADFTVPLAVMLAKNDPKKMELARLLHPSKYAETARIVRLQPYDPNKAVVLVIHGLMDSQATWTPMINELRGNEEIRKNYQFWFYSYPSGYPYPYSASILRRELDAVQKKFPLKKPIVVVGHSMGGCISRLLITDTEEKVWDSIFTKKPAELNIPQSDKKLLEEALIFRHRPEVGRAILIAAPLKGSNLANNWLARLGSKLVKSPVTLIKAGENLMLAASFRSEGLGIKGLPNSVDTMSPKNRFVKAINTLPIVSGIPCHTIIGDRGKRDSPDSSDGFVPYWSSHLDGATSEKIVPSGHSVHQHPQAIEEVKRILLSNKH